MFLFPDNIGNYIRQLEKEKTKKFPFMPYEFPEYTPIVKKRKWYKLWNS